MTRPPIDTVMMTVAEAMACRATCVRRAVGAVITTRDNRILATGYNGVPRGQTHCLDTPCPGAHAPSGRDIDLCQAVHAEQNALVNCLDIRTAAKIYVTTMPCVSCIKLLINTGIQHIYFRDTYPDMARALELWLRDPARVCTQID